MKKILKQIRRIRGKIHNKKKSREKSRDWTSGDQQIDSIEEKYGKQSQG